ncbi:hypothetical protein V8E54_004681 [Elaphomyces granulatus]
MKFKSQASSSRAAASGFGTSVGSFGSLSRFSSGSFPDAPAPSSIAEPLDLSRISEPQLVVAFKNLLKRDDITKSKALEDLRDYVLSLENRSDSLEDGLLDAWISVYPRTSIENSRKVRQLAHLVQGLLASLAGKRIARYLPKVIGAWLAGLYDNDRLVSRAVQESIIRVFSTEEKRNNIWKIFQGSILEFVADIIFQQTPQTLSDERTVKPDDAEAKYNRVVATAILLLDRILSTSTKQEIEKDLALVQRLLSSKPIWRLSYCKDPFVRQATYRLLRSSLSQVPALLDWKLISVSIVEKSLSVPQLGSASELSEVLLQLTNFRTQIWSEDYRGKVPASKSLRHYIQGGSQGASDKFWLNLVMLLHTLPLKTLSGSESQIENGNLDFSGALSLMEAFQRGLNSRDEPRTNLETAWRSYIDIGTWLTTLLAEDNRQRFTQTSITPILEQYVLGAKGRSPWNLPTKSAITLCTESFIQLIEHGHEAAVRSSWIKISEEILQAVNLSLPEQLVHFKSSQDLICEQANKFFMLDAAVLSRVSGLNTESRVLTIIEEASVPLLVNSLQLLQERSGKPYGAAAVIEEAVHNVPGIVNRSGNLMVSLKETIPNLSFSPSAAKLMAIVFAFHNQDGFGTVTQKVIEQIVKTKPEESNLPAIQKLLSLINFTDVRGTAELESMIHQDVQRAANGDRSEWSTIVSVAGNPTLPAEFLDRILLWIMSVLSSDDSALEALYGLSEIVIHCPTVIKRFQDSTHGLDLFTKLLYLRESPDDELANYAESLKVKFDNVEQGNAGSKSKLQILRQSFDEVNAESLSVESLVSIAQELLLAAKHGEESILPNRRHWEMALELFLALPPRPSTAITSPLGGVVYLIETEPSSSFLEKLERIPRDFDYFSCAFRLTYYVIKVLSSSSIMEVLNSEEQETLFYYLPIAIQLIDDDLNVEGCNGLIGSETSKSHEELMEVVHEGWALVRHWIVSIVQPDGSENICAYWKQKLATLKDFSPEGYRVGQAFVRICSEAAILGTTENMASQMDTGNSFRTLNVICAAALVAAHKTMTLLTLTTTKMCNELVADVTGMNFESNYREGLQKLCLLNVFVEGDDLALNSIPTQRLVFLVKNLVRCFQSGFSTPMAHAEICKLLAGALRPICEIYGSFWADIIDDLISVWDKTSGCDESLSLLHGSFRLFACLKSFWEANDDLKDAWVESKTKLSNGLILTLKKLDFSNAFHRPCNMTADTLCHQISSLSIESIPGVEEIYPLLASRTKGVQQGAFEVLHQIIPKAQEQVSFEAALSKGAVSLPDELLSLLLEAPTLGYDAHGETQMWIGLRSYLLSWKIVFDHFTHASLPVQQSYSSQIKEHGSLNQFLEFAFEFLQGDSGKLINASIFEIRSFELHLSEREIPQLFVHLYFLSLKYLPNLTKTWWIDSKKRFKGPIEAWTRKFISPLIIEDSLISVSEWIGGQDPTEERPLSVKVSPKAAEIIADISVDEESPPVAIAINLPPEYPLQPALVTGRTRVLVDEKTWRSWLLIIQGAIMFSNGNLIDGLLVFRRNVHGALKGQSECAICYSVVSTDMQTANKRCATCKNTFHSVCLYRWFKSSNQNTCPLCRNNFVFV